MKKMLSCEPSHKKMGYIQSSQEVIRKTTDDISNGEPVPPEKLSVIQTAYNNVRVEIDTMCLRLTRLEKRIEPVLFNEPSNLESCKSERDTTNCIFADALNELLLSLQNINNRISTLDSRVAL